VLFDWDDGMRNALLIAVGGWIATLVTGSGFFGQACTGWMDLRCLLGAGVLLLVTQWVAAVQFFRYARAASPDTVGRQAAYFFSGVCALIVLGLLWFAGAVVLS
jgi:hypothetical protein